jgi:hypothetical protein
MSYLSAAFFGEGATDFKFLPPIIERTLNQLVPYANTNVDPFDDLRGEVSGLSQIEKMLKIAEAAYGYKMVIFHLDADAPTTEHAYSRSFVPGHEAILRAFNEGAEVNERCIPLIPVRATEAWMLVDFEAFHKVTVTPLSADQLGFPRNPRQVESIPDPKQVLNRMLKEAQPGRRRTIDARLVYRPLAEQISLEQLGRVPAYQEFQARLSDLLRELHFLD